MTKIEIICDSAEIHLSAEGHATGSPEACNGLSALLYTLGAWIDGTAIPAPSPPSPLTAAPWPRTP